MKYSKAIALFLTLMISLIGCNKREAPSSYSGSSPSSSSSSESDSGKLTKSRAQNALDAFIRRNGSGSVQVLGVQDSENSATADLSFSNFQQNITGTYSGAGTAYFSHYNDGRWFLKKVTVGSGFNTAHWDIKPENGLVQ